MSSVTVKSYVQNVKGATNNALRMTARIIGGTAESHAKEYCPVKTGRLRNSITHNVEDNLNEQGGEITVAVGTNVKYAPYVELGHNQEPGRYVPAIKKRLVADHVAAKPYLRPAFEKHLQEYEQIIENTLHI